MNNTTPKTVSFSGDGLLKMKREGKISEGLLNILRERAEAHLLAPRLAVTERRARGISGDPHDYASYGTYWWPNPDTPDGLPFVRRDGEESPFVENEITYRRMTAAAFELSLAAFWLGEEKYARAAERILYDWHLNPETYMTPHAEYSQSIPGICDGRGIGIIDFSMSSYQVFDAVGILEYLGYISEERISGIKKWYSDFADWCLTSEKGNEEECEPNNHGTYFDVHILATAVFTGREALAKKVCATAYNRRITDQIEPDGSQPLELRRTMAMIYSISNLKAISLLVNLASSLGYAEYTSADPRYGDAALKKAVDFLCPYALDMKSFPYVEFKPELVGKSMKELLLWASDRFSVKEYLEYANKLSCVESLRAAYPMI